MKYATCSNWYTHLTENRYGYNFSLKPVCLPDSAKFLEDSSSSLLCLQNTHTSYFIELLMYFCWIFTFSSSLILSWMHALDFLDQTDFYSLTANSTGASLTPEVMPWKPEQMSYMYKWTLYHRQKMVKNKFPLAYRDMLPLLL